MHASISEKPQFVILPAFYPIALIVSYKFSAHHHPLISRVFHTRGGIITVANVQPLRVTELSNQLSFLGINMSFDLVFTDFAEFLTIYYYIVVQFILDLWLSTCIHLYLYTHTIPYNGKIHIVLIRNSENSVLDQLSF